MKKIQNQTVYNIKVLFTAVIKDNLLSLRNKLLIEFVSNWQMKEQTKSTHFSLEFSCLICSGKPLSVLLEIVIMNRFRVLGSRRKKKTFTK